MEKTISDLVNGNLNNMDEEVGFAPVYPYMESAFRDWLKNSRKISNETYIDSYIESYMSAYERLYDEMEVDAYDAFDHSLNPARQPFMRGYGLAVFEIYYMETMQEMLDDDENVFSKMEIRAFMAYRDFMAEVTGEEAGGKAPETQNLEVPYIDEFIAYLRSVGYKGRDPQKMASRLKLTSRWFSPAIREGYNLFQEAASLKTEESIDKLMAIVEDEAKTPDEKCVWKQKSISNATTIIRRYFDFLKWRNKH